MKGQVTNEDILKAINDFRKEVREIYVTKDEFEPIKRAVYGVISILGGALVLAIAKLVIAK